MKEENKEIVKKKEEEFQKSLKLFRETGETKYKDEIFFAVQDACLNIAKSKANGIVINDLEGKSLDATCKIFEKILEGENPRKLSSYCYLPTIGEIWSKKAIRWDRSVSFDGLFDNYATEEEDGFVTICSSYY